jgi:hypothetical protein
MTKVLSIKKATREMILESAMASFNYSQRDWVNKLNRLDEMNAEYFIEEGNYDYPRYFAKYTTPEGLHLFSNFSLVSCMHNGGFAHTLIFDLDEHSGFNRWFLKEQGFDIAGHEEVVVFTKPFADENGKLGRVENTPQSRKFLANSMIVVSNSI